MDANHCYMMGAILFFYMCFFNCSFQQVNLYRTAEAWHFVKAFRSLFAARAGTQCLRLWMPTERAGIWGSICCDIAGIWCYLVLFNKTLTLDSSAEVEITEHSAFTVACSCCSRSSRNGVLQAGMMRANSCLCSLNSRCLSLRCIDFTYIDIIYIYFFGFRWPIRNFECHIWLHWSNVSPGWSAWNSMASWLMVGWASFLL